MSHVLSCHSLAALATTSLLALAQPALADTTARPHGVESAQMVPAKPSADTSRTLSDAQKRAQRAQAAAAYRKAGGCAKSKPASSDADFSFQGFGDSGGCANSRR
jgi:hypothetical protein